VCVTRDAADGPNDFGSDISLHADVHEQHSDGGAAASHGVEDVLQRCGGAAGDDGDAAGEDGERAFAVVVKPAECADFRRVSLVAGACADGLESFDDERDLAGFGVEVDAAAGDHLLAVFRGEGHFAGGVCEDGAGDGGLFVFEVKVPVRAFTEAGDFADDPEGIGHALLEGGVDACGELRDGDGLVGECLRRGRCGVGWRGRSVAGALGGCHFRWVKREAGRGHQRCFLTPSGERAGSPSARG
jgi:hypothetical protein